MMKYIFYLSLFLTFATVEVKADIFDDAVNSIGGFFTDLGGKMQNLSEDDFNNFKNKVEGQVNKLVEEINDSDLTAKVEKVFNDAKKKVNNVVKEVDLNDIQNQVDKLIQDAKEQGTEAGIEWNSSTSLKFSSVTVVMILFSAYMIA